MTITLVVVTVLAVAAAAAASFVAWRVSRDERARSEARVAALAQAIDADIDPSPAPEPRTLATGAARTASVSGASPSERPTREAARAASQPLPGFDVPVAGVGTMFVSQATGDPPARDAAGGNPEPLLAYDAPVAGVGTIFASPAGEQPGPRRLAPAIVLGALVTAAIVGAVAVSSGPGDASATSAPQALELLALRHVQKGGTTTVSGVIRNPATGAAVSGVTTVVFFFDARGGFLSSARESIDAPRLGAGEESAFQVGTPTPPGVARYRVSFRLAEGGIVPHVDRREPRE